jgi:copper resistance protein B
MTARAGSRTFAAAAIVMALAGNAWGQTAVEEPHVPVPPVTEADREAAFPDVDGHAVHDSGLHYFVLFDRLEWQTGATGGLNWDNKSWIGGDVNRAWVRAEGATDGGRIEDAEAHVLYGRAVRPWWDIVAGLRQDFRPGPSRTWAAVGVQGLAPQWFEVEATVYVGESGHTAARVEIEYELLVTNRLILQPLAEIDLYGRSIPERGVGAGLSSGELGLRLRYEIRREFAPYLGASWQRQFGETADYARADGRDAGGWRAAAGVRMWF